MIKLFVYPVIAAKVAAEILADTAKVEAQKFVHQVFIDTLSDAKEINDLKAELAVLRSEVNELKHHPSSKRTKVATH